MANFKTHFVVAAAVSGTGASALLAVDRLEPDTAALAFALGTTGGFLPDVDAERSTPVQLTFTAVAMVLAFVVVFAKRSAYSVAEMFVLWWAIFVAVRVGLLWLFQSFTVHRGMFHSIPAAALAGVLCVNTLVSAFGIDADTAWLMGGFVALGYLVHLALDELVSVNLFGRRIKRSLGTALKLYQPGNLWASAVAWGGLSLALVLAPDPVQAIERFDAGGLMAALSERWWPSDGRWFSDWW